MRINVPFRNREAIWVEVDRFKLIDEIKPYVIPPVDAFSITEIVLKLNVIPFPGLFHKYRIDAALSPNLKDIYVDEETYCHFEEGKRWEEKRLRFSLAHELGHYFLHAHDIQTNRFTSIKEFKDWAGNPANYASAEYQADEFAGRLLVPRENLLQWYDSYRKVAEENDPPEVGLRSK